jgi:hypothetical protein
VVALGWWLRASSKGCGLCIASGVIQPTDRTPRASRQALQVSFSMLESLAQQHRASGVVFPRFRGVGLLGSRHDGCFVMDSLVFDRGQHPAGAVTAVVEDLKVLEHGACEFDSDPPSLTVEELDLHASPEGFDRRVASASPTDPMEGSRLSVWPCR